jgi:hypothetical protein
VAGRGGGLQSVRSQGPRRCAIGPSRRRGPARATPQRRRDDPFCAIQASTLSQRAVTQRHMGAPMKTKESR